MAVWFFGLLHELGHGQRLPAHLVESGLLATDTIRDAVGSHLDGWDIAAQLGVGSLLHEIEADPSHPLNPASLRAELAADLFAVSVLLQATVDIKRRAATGDLDPARLPRWKPSSSATQSP